MKDNKEINLPVEKLSYIDLSKVTTEIDKVNLVKDNVVKITNKLKDNLEIIGSGFFDNDGYL